MRKVNELSIKTSCLNKAKDFEMVFVLLSRDPAAPVAIQAWIDERIRLGLNQVNDDKLHEAKECGNVMMKEKDQHKRIIK